MCITFVTLPTFPRVPLGSAGGPEGTHLQVSVNDVLLVTVLHRRHDLEGEGTLVTQGFGWRRWVQQEELRSWGRFRGKLRLHLSDR